jgi:hypothetical protein
MKANNIYKFIEKEIINTDKEFYEELMVFRGDIDSQAAHQAWLDWASDLLVERYSINFDEAFARLASVEDYYKYKGDI